MPEVSQGTQLPQGQAEPAQGVAITPTQPQAPSQDLMIPKWRFDETTKLYKDSEARISQLTAEIEQLKQSNGRIAELEKELTDTKKGYEIEKKNAKRDSAIEAAVKDKAVDIDVVKKLIDLEKISVEEEGVKGLDEQIKELQTAKPFLWKKAASVVTKSATSSTRPERTFAQKLADNKVKQLGVTAKSKNYFN